MTSLTVRTVVVLLFTQLCGSAHARTWTNKSGNMIEARFLDLNGRNVQIVRSDGVVFSVPLDQFSAKDQEFVQEIAKFTREAPPSDVLITKSGSQYAGTIDEGNLSYRVTKSDGTQLNLPRSSIKEIQLGKELLDKYKARLRTADLYADETVRTLADATAKYGLDVEHNRLLVHAYLLRRERSSNDPDSLRNLANWCDTYRLSQAEACRREAAQLEFESRFKSAQGNGIEMAKLSSEYRGLELTAEADRAAKAARSISPADPKVEEFLNPAWKVTVRQARVIGKYEESLATSELSLDGGGSALVRVDVEFSAVRTGTTTYGEWLNVLKEKGVSEVVLSLIKVKDDDSATQPVRTLMSTDVRLVLPDESIIKPTFTTNPPGEGTTRTNRHVTISYTRDRDVRYYREEGLTILFVVPKKQVSLGFLFRVPKATKRAVLKFADLPSIDISFGS